LNGAYDYLLFRSDSIVDAFLVASARKPSFILGNDKQEILFEDSVPPGSNIVNYTVRAVSATQNFNLQTFPGVQFVDPPVLSQSNDTLYFGNSASMADSFAVAIFVSLKVVWQSTTTRPWVKLGCARGTRGQVVIESYLKQYKDPVSSRVFPFNYN
jgi:hypothetical protein